MACLSFVTALLRICEQNRASEAAVGSSSHCVAPVLHVIPNSGHLARRTVVEMGCRTDERVLWRRWTRSLRMSLREEERDERVS